MGPGAEVIGTKRHRRRSGENSSASSNRQEVDSNVGVGPVIISVVGWEVGSPSVPATRKRSTSDGSVNRDVWTGESPVGCGVIRIDTATPDGWVDAIANRSIDGEATPEPDRGLISKSITSIGPKSICSGRSRNVRVTTP